ncbi:hypothetical protein Y032_0272g947 [Ancylostoma ceylanicum]|uniref:Uncharacterized protein n=1 Tax=Ancylostoma ceylanicum TaxID=53326 RepID=A0A016S9C5_9BILA|nr:hypothetical protein Y032_0272g947 [Ancylostoma ceylanicum]
MPTMDTKRCRYSESGHAIQMFLDPNTECTPGFPRNRLYVRLCRTPNCVICSFGREEDCMVSSVVYLITCQACGNQYIGETGRPLCIRVKEDLDGMTRSRISTPLGVYRRHSHECSFAVAVTILK